MRSARDSLTRGIESLDWYSLRYYAMTGIIDQATEYMQSEEYGKMIGQLKAATALAESMQDYRLRTFKR